MPARVFLYAFIVWLVFLCADALNNALERALASPNLGEYGGHIFSVIRLACLVVVVTYLFIVNLEVRTYNKSDLLFIGVLWVVLSIFAEFVYGRYFKYRPWDELLWNYDIRNGKLKGLVLLSELVSPYLFGIWRSKKGRLKETRR